jgi:hypothetical protein
VRFEITHRFRFGSERTLVGEELTGSERWDALRLRSHGPFALAGTRAELEARADADDLTRRRAEELDALVGPRSLASYGAGTAVLELWLARLRPERLLVVTEFAPETAQRLASLLPEVDVRRHDLRLDRPLDADVHLFFRIDTELDDSTFRDIFRRFGDVSVVVVATELLTLRAAARELYTRLHKDATRAGVVRTRDAFEALWEATHAAHKLEIADLHGWLLEPRRTRGG